VTAVGAAAAEAEAVLLTAVVSPSANAIMFPAKRQSQIRITVGKPT